MAARSQSLSSCLSARSILEDYAGMISHLQEKIKLKQIINMKKEIETILDIDRVSPVRHGVFLGEIKPDKIIFLKDKIKGLIDLEINCLDKNSESYRILSDIYSKMNQEDFFSNIHQQDLAVSFSFSDHEMSWLEKHDPSRWLDYIIFRYKFKLYPARRTIGDFPLHLLIEPVSFCNLKCIMCFQSDPSFAQQKYYGTMRWGLFTSIIDQAKEHKCGAITIASRGEPTLHKDFGKMLLYISKYDFLELKININATRLTESLCHEILSAGVNEVIFSVDAADKETYEKIRRGGKFEDIVRNIELFHMIRKEYYQDSQTVTRISGVKVIEEQDIKKIYQFWHNKVDQIVIKKAVPRWDTYNNAASDINIPCKLPWERMYIWFDGTVNPCDYDYKSNLAVGKVGDRKIEEIWKGEEFNRLRQYHLTDSRRKLNPCDRCPLY
ncbi:MAG TPA: radical SAM protein [Candidatus Methylomirabilis sp.]|nr:radical SAM protein [Candidatus Methylomirabilis sp.]